MKSQMIRASAGTGKTFQLSMRYLALLASGAEPSSLIALTFTRKAAAEFSQRILSRLAEGAISEALAQELAGELSAALGDIGSNHDKSSLGVERFRRLLELLVSQLHRLALSTFDSFFIRIVRHFPYELGLAEFRLMNEDEVASKRREVIRTAFDSLSPEFRGAFIPIFNAFNRGKLSIKVTEPLFDFVAKCHEIYQRVPEAERWGNMASLLGRDVITCVSEKDMQSAVEVLRKLAPELKNSEGKPVHKSWHKSFEKILKDFENDPSCRSIQFNDSGKRYLANLEKLAEGYFIDTYSKQEIPLVGEAAYCLHQLFYRYWYLKLEFATNQTKAIHALMMVFETHYQARVRSAGLLTFNDITRLLSGAGLSRYDQNEREDGKLRIDQRLDAQYHHWLLDEFQDTSCEQVKVLEQVLDEAVLDAENERSVFVVGDLKQSIYGWRGGEPRLFDELLDRPSWSEHMLEKQMSMSYRSAPEVLDLANALCCRDNSFLKSHISQETNSRWNYPLHQTAKNLAGYFAVLAPLIAGDENEDSDDNSVLGEIDLIADILGHTQVLKRGLTCAILVRTNADASKIADGLRIRQPDLPVEIEANISYGTDQPLSAAVIDWFSWIQHPGNSFAQNHVLASPFGKVLQTWGDSPEAIWQASQQRWLKRGISGLLKEMLDALREVDSEPILNRFLNQRADALEQLALAFDRSGSFDLNEWQLTLKHALQRDSATEHAIQIMTVHKAKGLEFDMVIIADLGSKGFDVPKPSSMMLLKQGTEIDHVLISPSYDILKADPVLQTRHQSWSEEQCFENLCTFYVALTRAKFATYLIGKPLPKSISGSMLRFDVWINTTYPLSDECIKIAGTPWSLRAEHGTPNWFEVNSLLQKSDAVAEEKPARPSLPEPKQRRARSTPSAQKTTSRGALNHAGKDFGTDVHRLFESITWLDEISPNLPLNPAGNAVRAALSEDTIKQLLSRDHRNVELYHEQAFEVMLDERWLSGVIDRLHLFRDEKGEVTHLQIIDFKTDNVENPDELVTRYHGQMNAYARALRSVFPDAEQSIVLLSTKHRCLIPIQN